jgi:hypothetical protein
MADGPRVEPIGPLLMGQAKWLGGVNSPDGQYIYGVPGHATRVLRVTVATGEVDLIGPEYVGHHKWLRGVCVPPEFTGPEHPQGLCYCLPSNYPAVLQIDPATHVSAQLCALCTPLCTVHRVPRAACSVQSSSTHAKCIAVAARKLFTPLARGKCCCCAPITTHASLTQCDCFVALADSRAFAPCSRHTEQEVTTIGGHLEEMKSDWLWHGGNLGNDGCVYGIPCNAKRVLKINPRTGECSTIGPEFPVGIRTPLLPS